jgi:hypothetical protein
MSDSQPQQASGGQQSQQLLRPDDILKLQCLPEDEKQKYRLIMQNFWSICNNNPPGSQENTNARQKLTEWSQKFIGRERQYRAKMKAQQQQGNQNQGQVGQSSAAGQQNANAIKQEAGQAPNRAAEGAGAPANQQSQGQQPPNQGQNPGRGQVDPAIVKHVHEFPMQGPTNGPTPGTPEYENKIKEYRAGYLNMLAKQASYNEQRRRLVHQLTERQNNGQEIPQDQLMLKNNIEKESAKIKAQIDKFRAMQKQWKEEREQNAQGQAQVQAQPQGQNPAQSPLQQQQQQQQQSQAPQRQLSQPNVTAQPQVKEEPQIKIEGGQPLQPQSQSQTQPQPQPQQPFNMQTNQGNHQQGPPQQQHNQQHNQPLPPSLAQQPQMQQQQQQQARPPPGPHSQTMPPNQMPQFSQQGQQQQNFHQPQPQQQQQQRPQINPMQANAHQQSNSPHPQSAASNAPGPPVPLSHQAAVSAANRSYTDPQRTNTPMQQGGQGGNFGSREREQLNNPKMPIPRHLNVTSPQAVHMGQSRPTMSGPTNGAPGPMGQPVIPRPPPFQLEGEGDRVLSKRKLDELVRQVTGGSEEALTPEVEEVSDVFPAFRFCAQTVSNHMMLIGRPPAGGRFCRQRHQQRVQALQAARLTPA